MGGLGILAFVTSVTVGGAFLGDIAPPPLTPVLTLGGEPRKLHCRNPQGR